MKSKDKPINYKKRSTVLSIILSIILTFSVLGTIVLIGFASAGFKAPVNEWKNNVIKIIHPDLPNFVGDYLFDTLQVLDKEGQKADKCLFNLYMEVGKEYEFSLDAIFGDIDIRYYPILLVVQGSDEVKMELVTDLPRSDNGLESVESFKIVSKHSSGIAKFSFVGYNPDASADEYPLYYLSTDDKYIYQLTPDYKATLIPNSVGGFYKATDLVKE